MHLPQLKRSVACVGIALAAMTGTAAHAGIASLNLDVNGAASAGDLGEMFNEVRTWSIGAGVHIIGLSWNVSISTVGTSWLSEAGFDLAAANGDGASLFPGLNDDFDGAESYSGSEDLVAGGTDFFLGQDGVLTGRFFESFYDASNGDPDAFWRGSVTVTYVPEPASYGLAALGLLGIAAVRRRRA